MSETRLLDAGSAPERFARGWHCLGLAESFRDGVPVIMNLSQMSDAEARRLIDFASGLASGLFGRIERVTSKVFLLSPENIAVSGDGAVAHADPEAIPFSQQ